MIKHLPFTDTLLKSLSALAPELQIEIANSKLIRGQTAKGRYDIRVWGEGAELRTSFLGRGRNPLTLPASCAGRNGPAASRKRISVWARIPVPRPERNGYLARTC